jgi:hypothetical protein
MPLGQVPLSGSKLAQIEEWIRAGASCGGDVPNDAGAPDAPNDGAGESLADVASITAVATTIHVDEVTQVTVTLTHGAPSGGQTIIFDLSDADLAVLAVPNALHVDPGISSVTFDVRGKALGPATITANAGTNAMSITMMVTSLTLLDDKGSTTQLATKLPVHGSLVIGNPTKVCTNSNAAYGCPIESRLGC